jgi:hypothetical protein|nr:MAG TPA: hypothetical protein [Caudoviricetes sp.]
MEAKEFKIQVPEGYEIDKEKSTFEKIVFKKVDDLPKSWEELEFIDGFFVSSLSDIAKIGNNTTNDKNNKNVFPTKEEAEACLALAQLCQLRDRYNDGWKPDWEDSYVKYILYYWGDDITKTHCTNARTLLSFKTQKLRDEFLENFRDLIETAKPLL